MPPASVHPLAAYNRVDPYRAPRWRYDRAAEMVQNRRIKRPHPSRDDEPTATTFAFLRDWRRLARTSRAASHEARVINLYPKYPGLFLAYEAFLREHDDRSRTELEARILAGQDDATIETKTGFPAMAVDWYEKVFFNVRERLHQRRYIARHVIQPIVNTGLANLSFDLSAKFFAYFAGPTYLDFVLDQFVGPAFDPTSDDFLEYSDRLYETSVRLRSLPTVQFFEVNGFSLEQLLITHNQLLIEHRKPKEGGGGAGTSIEEGVQAMLNAIPWCVGSERAAREQQLRINKYTSVGVELRAADQLLVAGGETPAHLEGVEHLRLPPPRHREKPNEAAQ